MLSLDRSVKLIFTGGHISLMAAFKGPNVILGLYRRNYSLTRGNKVLGQIKQGGGQIQPKGLVFATCDI